MMKLLKKYRKSPSLWVTLDGPGKWYINELRAALAGSYQPIAIAAAGQELSISSFNKLPGSYPGKPGAPGFPTSVFDEFSLPQKERAKLQVLRALARMSIAGTKEIASSSGYSHTYMRKLLPELVQGGYILYHEKGVKEKRIKAPTREIKRSGIQYAHQSWNIPDNLPFRGIRVEQKYAGQKHRRMARMWWAWLKEAYGADYEIWQVWPEPSIGNAHPDALAWGSYQGVETLAWLEVESGKKSGDRIVRDIMYRYDQAFTIAEIHDLRMIFVVLAQPWVLRAPKNRILFDIPQNVTIIFENWRNTGILSKPIFGDFGSIWRDKNFSYLKNHPKVIKKQPDFLISKISSTEVNKSLNEHPS